MSILNPVVRVEPGTKVTITKGVFAGMTGEAAEVWSGEEVVLLTLIVFGRSVRVELDPWSLAPPLLPREDEWPEEMSLRRMLASVQCHSTNRQLRQFAVACCRRILHLMTEERCVKLVERTDLGGVLEGYGPWPSAFLMRTVEMMEREAEGADLGMELECASKNAGYLAQEERNSFAGRDESDGPIDYDFLATCLAPNAVEEATRPNLSLLGVAHSAARAVYRSKGGTEYDEAIVDPDETAAQRELVRDIFGRPLHLTAADPRWLTPTVLQLAQGISEERAWDRMPILGDALEDAGCDDEKILSHLRGPGPHVRGCWVIDLLCPKDS